VRVGGGPGTVGVAVAGGRGVAVAVRGGVALVRVAVARAVGVCVARGFLVGVGWAAG
jgi:hypothetical protein